MSATPNGQTPPHAPCDYSPPPIHTQGMQAKLAGEQQSRKTRCPGKGGAKRSAGAYTSDFYTNPVIPPGARRGPQYRVTDEEDVPAEPACINKAALFTPPQKCAVARRPEQRPATPPLGLRGTPTQTMRVLCGGGQGGAALLCQRTCRASTATGGPAGPAEGGTASGGAYPWVGGTPSAKRHKRQRALAPGPDTPQAREGGRDPPPPAKRMRCQSPSAARHGRAGTEVT